MGEEKRGWIDEKIRQEIRGGEEKKGVDRYKERKKEEKWVGEEEEKINESKRREESKWFCDSLKLYKNIGTLKL